MLGRFREAISRGSSRRDWLEILYLTNMTVIILAVVVYLFPIPIPPGLHPLITLLIGFVVFSLLWYLVDGFGAIRESPVLSHLYRTPGLRWLDALLAGLALVVLVGAWRLQRLNEAIGVVAGLVLVNAVISATRFHSHYDEALVPPGEAEGLTPTPPEAPEPTEPPVEAEELEP